MPRFRDTQTDREFTETSTFRVSYFLSSPVRFLEVAAEDEVPDGTVAEVLEWAGDDPDRQARALAAERAGKKRKGIIEALG